MKNSYKQLATLSCISLLMSQPCWADGMVVDKVYQPYVLPNETEIEWRLISHDHENGNRLMQRVGVGYALSSLITMEGYLIGQREKKSNDFDLHAYELELRMMLTEQGQYAIDAGVMFEFERLYKHSDYEASAGLLLEKEFDNVSVTANAFLIYEWGENLANEFELETRLKLRYRWMPEIQPAVEVYTGENYFGMGPSAMGIVRLERQKQIKWELGFITELSQTEKDHALRLSIEYEF
jgi:hypothetical protein